MRFVVYRDKKGLWRWKAVSRNGKVIADGGEGYKRPRSLLKSLGNFKQQAMYAIIVEEK